MQGEKTRPSHLRLVCNQTITLLFQMPSQAGAHISIDSSGEDAICLDGPSPTSYVAACSNCLSETLPRGILFTTGLRNSTCVERAVTKAETMLDPSPSGRITREPVSNQNDMLAPSTSSDEYDLWEKAFANTITTTAAFSAVLILPRLAKQPFQLRGTSGERLNRRVRRRHLP